VGAYPGEAGYITSVLYVCFAVRTSVCVYDLALIMMMTMSDDDDDNDYPNDDYDNNSNEENESGVG
jgi:hypothetical protein